jgi:hypothetical protein
VLPDGDTELIGKAGTFGVRHVHVPVRGAAVQINAFNFPVWGMLEKLAPAILAGVPSVVKPASQTAYLAEAVFRRIIESGILPEGAVQLTCARPDGLLDELTGQDLLSVTGSAATARSLRTHPAVNAVRFTAEADSLNCSILGPDAGTGTPEFDLFVTQLVTEMTVKAGQKCTAIRRAFVPAAVLDDVEEAVAAKLAEITVGNPADPSVTMGALASLGQRDDVRGQVRKLAGAARLVHGDPDRVELVDADAERGAFLAPLLLRCDDASVREPHEVEAFGPVSTLLPYDGTEQAVAVRGPRRGQPGRLDRELRPGVRPRGGRAMARPPAGTRPRQRRGVDGAWFPVAAHQPRRSRPRRGRGRTRRTAQRPAPHAAHRRASPSGPAGHPDRADGVTTLGAALVVSAIGFGTIGLSTGDNEDVGSRTRPVRRAHRHGTIGNHVESFGQMDLVVRTHLPATPRLSPVLSDMAALPVSSGIRQQSLLRSPQCRR